MTQIMARHGIPGGSLAIAKDGKLVYAKGFGWADLKTGTPVKPQTTFGLASLSKPITALSTLLLVERGQLELGDPALFYLRHISPPKGVPIDPRLKNITIRHLLNHTGGWDRNVSSRSRELVSANCPRFQSAFAYYQCPVHFLHDGRSP